MHPKDNSGSTKSCYCSAKHILAASFIILGLKAEVIKLHDYKDSCLLTNGDTINLQGFINFTDQKNLNPNNTVLRIKIITSGTLGDNYLDEKQLRECLKPKPEVLNCENTSSPFEYRISVRVPGKGLYSQGNFSCELSYGTNNTFKSNFVRGPMVYNISSLMFRLNEKTYKLNEKCSLDLKELKQTLHFCCEISPVYAVAVIIRNGLQVNYSEKCVSFSEKEEEGLQEYLLVCKVCETHTSSLICPKISDVTSPSKNVIEPTKQYTDIERYLLWAIIPLILIIVICILIVVSVICTKDRSAKLKGPVKALSQFEGCYEPVTPIKRLTEFSDMDDYGKVEAQTLLTSTKAASERFGSSQHNEENETRL